MDAKRTRGLVFLAFLSLFCSGIAWAADHAVFSSVFAALGAVATLSAAPWHWGRSGVTMTEKETEMLLLVALTILMLALLAFGAALVMMR